MHVGNCKFQTYDDIEFNLIVIYAKNWIAIYIEP